VDLPEIISAVQKALGVEVDGTAGPETWNAIYNRICRGKAGPPRKTSVAVPAAVRAGARDRVDDRSEKAIATLLPQVQPYARALVKKAAQHGITIKVIGGLRTYEEQNELFAQGRTKPGRIVTNARGGFSNHNFGIAFDVGVFEGANYLGESPKYKAVGALGMDLGLEWGGNWKTHRANYFGKIHFTDRSFNPLARFCKKPRQMSRTNSGRILDQGFESLAVASHPLQEQFSALAI
jgi:peptidoglycan L-alanyl-D-glutamate endopeptidase CwlK